MLTASISSLTRRMGQMALKGGIQPVFSTPLLTRSLATRKKGPKKHKKDHRKPQNAQSETQDNKQASLQHQEWVQFQKSIVVEGFATGQTLQAKASTKKVRGGKALRRRESLQEQLDDSRRFTNVGGGRLPPLRYSDEETEKLLAQAYAAIPPRAGKRGTKNLKRQARRWHLVRKIHAKYKYHMRNHQDRKMEKRSRKMSDVKAVLTEAPSTVEKDRQYQLHVLEQWAAKMTQDQV